MRTDGQGKVIKVSINEQQENLKNPRKTLKVIQQAATDKENLVGRVQRIGKDLITNKLSQSDVEARKVKLIHRGTQTGKDTKIDASDLTSEAGPSEGYWEALAERRRVALDESLNENRKLIEENSALREENRICKEMLEESKSLVEVLTEMINETDNAGADEIPESSEETIEDN